MSKEKLIETLKNAHANNCCKFDYSIAELDAASDMDKEHYAGRSELARSMADIMRGVEIPFGYIADVSLTIKVRPVVPGEGAYVDFRTVAALIAELDNQP